MKAGHAPAASQAVHREQCAGAANARAGKCRASAHAASSAVRRSHQQRGRNMAVRRLSSFIRGAAYARVRERFRGGVRCLASSHEMAPQPNHRHAAGIHGMPMPMKAPLTARIRRQREHRSPVHRAIEGSRWRGVILRPLWWRAMLRPSRSRAAAPSAPAFCATAAAERYYASLNIQ